MLNATRRIASSRIGAVAVGATILATVGGTSAAVAHGLITSEDIVNQTIQKRDIGRGAVGMGEVRNHTLGMRDLNRYTRDKINEGTGSTGPQGPAGPAGEDGVSGYEVRNVTIGVRDTSAPGDFRGLNPGETATLTVECPDGKVALGGGVTPEAGSDQVRVHSSGPSGAVDLDEGTGETWGVTAWTAEVRSAAAEGGKQQSGLVWVTCATMR